MQKKLVGMILVSVMVMAALLTGCGKNTQTADNGIKEEEGQTTEHKNPSSQEEPKGEEAGKEETKPEGEAAGIEETKPEGEEAGKEETKPEEEAGKEDVKADEGEKVPATLNPDTVVYAEEEVCANARVNIRREPSTDGEVYRVAARREKFTRTANDGAWSAIVLDGAEYYVATEYLTPASEMKDNGYLVVIDAGHQKQGNPDKEPIGPGASETKAKVASGTTGVATGQPEYQLTLAVSLKLRDELEARGYQVLMVRESHDVDNSNAQRAQVANDAGADAFIRVHANGSDDSSVNGILTACQTSSNPYNGNLYSECRSLADCVLDGMVNATGAQKRSVWETDTMSGINWCQVPVTIVEMGFMTNPAEDQNMATESYQYQLAVGMADGIDAYFGM